MQRHSTQILLVATAFFVFALSPSSGFSPPIRSKQRFRISSQATSLSAWSIPSPSFSTQAFTFGSATWYNELDPTGRRMVYDDVPLDYTFVSAGDDWPTFIESAPSNSADEVTIAGEQSSSKNPLRRAAVWAGGRLRKHS